jgi:hypothetical protein
MSSILIGDADTTPTDFDTPGTPGGCKVPLPSNGGLTWQVASVAARES